MGVLMVAVFGGTTLGPLFGGFLADIVGFKTTFFITGGLLFLGGLIVLLFVKETFERPVKEQSASVRSVFRLAGSREILPLLMVISALNIGPQTVAPVIPLVIGELNPEGPGATASGLAFALMGIIAAISSFAAGRLGRRITLKTILIISCIGTGLLYLPPIWAGSVVQLVLFVGITGLLKGGIMTSSNALVSLSAPMSQQGIAYGLSQSATSLGSGLGPLIGGTLARLIGLRPVFGVAGGLFILVGILVTRLLVSRSSEKA